MQIVMLGGGGAAGAAAAEVVATDDGVDEIVVADLDLAAARVVAGRLRASRSGVSAAQVDVLDAAALDALLAGADVVLNTAGPFFRLGLPVLEAAIRTQTHYLDINDDPEPTVAMLGLHGRAAAAGVTAVIGVGASPGASNLLAVMACAQLDEVEDLFTVWPVDVAIEGQEELPDEDVDGESAALVHWMQQLSGTISVWERGGRVERAPLEPLTLHYPGRGSGTVYTVGHPEPLTLGPTCGVRGRALNLMAVQPGTAAFLETLRDDVDAGRLTLEAAAAEIAGGSGRRKLRAAVRSFGLKGPQRLPAFFALAHGRKDGATVRVGAAVRTFPAGMARCTGIPLALGLRQLLGGALPAGVWAPEQVLDAAQLFDALAPFCEPAAASGEDLVEVVSEVVSPTPSASGPPVHDHEGATT